MLLTIYDSAGNAKVELSPDDSSTQVTEIQSDNVLTLSFTHYDYIDLDVDDYTDFLGERYWMVEKYRPRQNALQKWVYNIKLYGAESMIKRLLVIKTVDGEEEPVFTLTAPPREHIAMIVNCINRGMDNGADWKVGQVDGTENIVIDYIGKYCDEALKEIAEKVGAEWWMDGQTVNICRCEHGEPVELGYDNGLAMMDPGAADNVKFYTRLYPVGSDRNIDRQKYGFSRLQLPGGQKYVEVNADKYSRIDHFELDAFAGIYPRRIGTVSGVRSEERTGEDGNPFTVWYVKDSDLPFDPNDYMIAGQVLRVSFQEGSELAGLGQEEGGTYYFEVNYDSKTQEFEIITIWPYDDGRQLPGDPLVPKPGDKYILWHLSMPDEYYALAENEFLEAVNEYNKKHSVDTAVYKASTDHVWIEDKEVELSVGRRVRLKSQEYFPVTGYRDSRITKITRKVNLPSQMDLEIGDALSRTSMQKLADGISDARSYARTLSMSVALPDIIRTGDSTKPTDYNLLSAKRSVSDFLSRRFADSATGLKKFLDGLDAGPYLPGVSGGHIGAEGDAELETLRLRESLTLGDYVPGVSGGTMYIDSNGEAHIDTAYLTVNKKMTVKELEIQQQRWVGGSQISSPAGMVCGRVEPVYAEDGTGTIRAWRCFFRAMDSDGRKIHNEFRVDDLARCETFNLMRDAQGMLQNRYYWRRVEYVSEDANPIVDDAGDAWHQINLSNGQGRYDPASNCAPAPEDHIITLGNATDSSRQNAIIIASYGEGAPYIYQLTGIDSFTTAGRVKTRISPNGNRFTGEFRLEVGGEDKGDVGELLSSADGKITTLEVTSDGIMGKVGKISRNLLRFNEGAWKDVYGIWAVSEQPAKGAFYCSQMDEWPEDKDTAYFRCAVDPTLFKPDTDYILTLYATWRSDITDDEGTDMPASMTLWASIQSADVNSVMAPTVRAEGEPYVWGRRIKQTFRLHTNKTWNPRSQMLNLRFFTGAGAPAWPTLTQFDVEEIKLEQGTFATPFVPGEQDLESVISQQADQIAMSVKVDGKERAGLALDAEEGITLQSDKVQIKNGDEIAALFAGGMLNANLINVGKLTTIVDGLKRITVSEFGDAFIRFYHHDGITVACKLGLENVTLETGGDITPVPTAANAQALTDSAISGDISIITGKPAIIQVYNETGDLTWVLFLDGPVTPDTQTYSWRTLSLVAPGSVSQALIETASTLKATEYWQFRVSGDKGKEPYLSQAGKVFTKKLADNEFTGAASYYVPNGRYYSPSVEIAPAAPGETATWRRRYYQITNGIMGPAQYITVTP